MVDIKGAPVTFDLERLKNKTEKMLSENNCDWPVYNRLLHNPVEDAVCHSPEPMLTVNYRNSADIHVLDMYIGPSLHGKNDLVYLAFRPLYFHAY